MHEFIKQTGKALYENKRLIIRAILTCAYYAMIFYVLRLLFFYKVSMDNRDLVNIIIGAILASFTQVTNFWFRTYSDHTENKEQNKG